MNKIFGNYSKQVKCAILGSVDSTSNAGLICKTLDISSRQLIKVKQIHKDRIIVIDNYPDEEPTGYDAMITSVRGLFLMIQVADCQAIMIYDPVKQVIANIHSGWKGSALNIVGKTINKMRETYKCNPKDLRAAISPSLGPCHAEFSDPINELPETLHKYISPNNHVDFWQATIDQCVAEGVLENQIQNTKICTFCNKDKYFSYRAHNKTDKRFASVIGIL